MPITLTYPSGGVLVTGGTGRVGTGIVRAMAEAGVPHVFTYRSNATAARALETELRDRGHAVTAVPMDIADPASIAAALDLAEAEGGPLRAVLVGSGTPVRFNRIMDFTIEEVERFVAEDALGTYRLFHGAVPRLRRSGGGVLLACATIATRRVIAYDGMSPLSKGSVDALVRQVAAEEGVHNIRCNAVAIGWVEEISVDEAQRRYVTGPPIAEPTDEIQRVQELVRQMAGLLRIRQTVSPLQAGHTYAWLASDQAAHLTGQTIALDHGILL